MGLAIYPAFLAYDPATGQAVPGVAATVTDPLTGVPLETLDLATGQPRQIFTNHKGHVEGFMVEDGPGVALVKVGSYGQGVPDLTMSVDMRDAALAAAQAAIDAANLVDAPADEVVALLVGGSTQTSGALFQAIEDNADTAPGLISLSAKSRALEGIPLGDRDLNDVVDPGRYHQNFVSYATALNHYPEFKSNTVLTVRAMASSNIVQHEAYAILTNRKFYRYRRSTGEWTQWQEHGSTQKSVRAFFAEEQRAYPITLTNTSIVEQIPGAPLPVLVRTGNSVELSGQLRVIPAGGGASVTTIGTIPPDAWPFNGRTRWYPQMSTGGKMYSILVSPTGTVQMYNLTGADANTTINLSATWAVKPPSRYAFERVCARMVENVDYARTLTDHGSWLSVIAIHGGDAETGTSEISLAIQQEIGASWYEWDFLKPTVQGSTAFAVAHEVNSTYGDYKGSLFDDPDLMEMIIRSDDCVAIHQAADGNGTNRPAGRLTCCGGENIVLRELIAAKLIAAGFPALDNPDDFPGLQGTGPKQPHNFAKNTGVQIEISVSQCREFFAGGDLVRSNRVNITPAFTAYKNAVVAALNEYRAG